MNSFFGFEEIRNSKALKAIAYILLVNLTFSLQYFSYAISPGVDHPLCFPFFQNCGFLQDIFLVNFAPKIRFLVFAFWHSILFLGFVFLYLDKIKEFFTTLLFFFIFIFTPLFVLTGFHHDLFTYPMHYVYFFALIFLFAKKDRIFYMQLFFVLTYFLSAISKFESESWLLGNMILPFVNQNLMPIFTNAIILLQLFSPLLLFSQKKIFKYSTLLILEIFHIYTISLVNIDFYLITSPLLLVLFYGNDEKFDHKKMFSSGAMILFFGLFFLSNILRLIIPKYDSITFEGAYTGLNMFQSEISCKIEYQDKNLAYKEIFHDHNKGYQRCDPYTIVTQLKKHCVDANPRNLRIQINFIPNSYEIVNEKNFCNLSYNAFSRNEWIQDKEIAKDLSKMNLLGQKLYPFKDKINLIYFSVFLIICLVFFFKTLRKHR